MQSVFPTTDTASADKDGTGPAPCRARAQLTDLLDGSPPAAPASLTGTPKSSTSIRLDWTPPADDGGSPITQYTLTRPGANPVNSGPDVRARTITNLTPDTSYTFTLKARNALGLGPGRTLTISTPPHGTPPGPPATLTGLAKTTTSIRLDWTPPADDGGSPITQYTLTRPGANPVNSGPDVRARTITNLTPDTSYTFTLKARNALGLGPGRTLTISTLPHGTPPGPPATLTGLAKTTTSIRLDWTPPADDGGSPITQYTLTRPGANPVNSGPDVRARTITNLTPDTSYTFTLKARNALGLGPGRTLTIRTLSGAPRPDALVRTNAGFFVGDDVYNTNGVDQTVQSGLARGGSATFYVRLQNDSGATDDLLAADVAPAPGSGLSRTWHDGATDVTQDVANGDLDYPGVAPGGSRELRLTVSASAGAQVGMHVFYLHVYHTPIGGTPIKDVVRVNVSVN